MTGLHARTPAHTHQTPFYPADEQSRTLFAVAAGIDTDTATVHAVDILQTAHTVLLHANEAEQNDLVDAAMRLLDMGIALVRACEATPPLSDDELAGALHDHPSAPIDAGIFPGRRRLETAYTLLRELQLARQIIVNALRIMTPEQKVVWTRVNEDTGCAGEGTTRANERDAAIDLARAILGEGDRDE